MVLKWAGLIFGGVGLCLLIGSGWGYAGTRRFVDAAMSAPGTVVGLEQRTSTTRENGYTRTSTTYAPVVRFTVPNEEPVEFRSSLSSSPPGYRVGDHVTVLYVPEDPDNAEIASFPALWLGVLITGGLGAAFTGIGALLLCLFHRERRGMRASPRAADRRRRAAFRGGA